MPRLLRPLALVFACLLSLISFCTHSCAEPLTDAMVAQDVRLSQKKVSFSSPRAFVGEVLEAWSAQTGVALSAHERSSASDEEIAIYIKDLPLADAMRALWSLMSYQKATWDWQRTGENGAYRYELRQSVAARELSAKVRGDILTDFNKHAETMIAHLKDTPEQRAKTAKDGQEGFLMNDAHVRGGVNTFAALLSPDKRSAIISGKERVMFELATAPADVQKYVFGDFEKLRSININAGYDVSQWKRPTHVHFRYDPDGISPTIFLLQGDETGGEGNAVFGGTPLDNKWSKNLSAMWLLPEDKADDASEALMTKKPEKSQMETPRKETLRTTYPFEYAALNRRREKIEVGLRLGQVAEATGIAIMARLSPTSAPKLATNDFGEPYAKLLSSYLEDVEGYGFIHKWNGPVLLLSSSKRFMAEEDKVVRPSWSLIKQLQAWQVQNPDGVLTFGQLAEMSAQCDNAQAKALVEAGFPNLAPVTGQWRLFLGLLHRHPEMEARLHTAEGVGFGEVRSSLEAALMLDKPERQGLRIRRVRLVESDLVDSYRGLVHTTTLQLISHDGKVLEGWGFAQVKNSKN